MFALAAPTTARPAVGRAASVSSFRGAAVATTRPVSARASRGLVVLAAEAPAAKPVKEEPKEFVIPPLDPNTPSPIFGGSTGGLLRKAQVRRTQQAVQRNSRSRPGEFRGASDVSRLKTGGWSLAG